MPQSKTSQAPAPPPTYSATDDKQETPAELEKRMRALMTQQNIVLFMKGDRTTPRCGFSRKIVDLLQSQNVADFATFDILKDEGVRQGESYSSHFFAMYVVLMTYMYFPLGLKKLNNWPTFPQLIIGGEFVGGLDIVKEMVENGELAELVAQ
jgi:glutaredoxin-related protein